MTATRDHPSRELFGVIGSLKNTSEEKRYWNHRFLEEGTSAFFDHYPTKLEELPERLSEMFHFDRRGYIVGNGLQEAIIPLLDAVDAFARGDGRVSVVCNRGGILTGYLLDDREEIWRLWLAAEKGT